MNKNSFYFLCSFLAVVFLLPHSSTADERLLPECFLRSGGSIDIPWSGESGKFLTVKKGHVCNFFRPGTIRYPFYLSDGAVLVAGEDKYHFLGSISVADQGSLFSIRALSMLDGSVVPPAPVYFRSRVHVSHHAEFEVTGAGALGDFGNKVLLQHCARMVVSIQAKMVVRDKIEIQSGSKLEAQRNAEILLEESSDMVVSGFERDGSVEHFSQIQIYSGALTANGAVTIGTDGVIQVWRDGEATFNAPLVLQDSPDTQDGYIPRLVLGDPTYESYFSTVTFNGPITLGRRSCLRLYRGLAVFRDGIQIHYPVSCHDGGEGGEGGEGGGRLQLMEGADVQIRNAEILIEQTPDCYIAPGERVWLIEATEDHAFSGIRLVSNRPLSIFSLKNELFEEGVTGWYALREKIPGGYQSMVSDHRMLHLANLLDILSQSDLPKPLSNPERRLLAKFDQCAEPGCVEVLLTRHETAIRHYIDLRHPGEASMEKKRTNAYRETDSIKITEIKKKEFNSFKQFVKLIVSMKMEQHVGIAGIALCLLVIARRQLPTWPAL